MNSVVTCGDNLEAVRDWIKLRDGELESVGPVGADLKSAMEQKEKLKVKEMNFFALIWYKDSLTVPDINFNKKVGITEFV